MEALLKLEGLEVDFKVVSVNFAFHQMVDGSGRPTSEVMSGTIQISVYPEKIDPKNNSSIGRALFSVV